MSDFEVGDWVFTIRAGVWQVYRIDHFKEIDPLSLELRDSQLVFVKRFINDAGKRAFTQDFYSPSLLFPIEGEAKLDFDLFVKNHPSLYAKFQAHKPEPINTVFQCRIDVPTHQSSADISEMFPQHTEFTQSEAAEFVKSLGFKSERYPMWTIEFISRDTTIRDGYIRYVFNRVLEF